ncbi:Oil body-associated protein 1B [Hypsizygus marmoreus]|uniref:Oil body-associated protein 1B n=1 Tax=Hypsizygus marmoreus TaxID=39966 RepID=A0A369K2F0_HYPMA|nr:Oil body-associated protein 1B [Hypsizygus marmoreus]
MDSDTKQSVYHSAAFSSIGATLVTFKPIDEVHQHLCAFHTYSQDRSRHVEAHHFCTHLSPDLHQCVIYDSDEPNAKLIGIEYIITEKVFKTLPQEEKKYWHSHKYEVESGLLQLQIKGAVPGLLSDEAEQPAMLELQKTYGKTIHTWAIDQTPDLPLGPPNLMMSYTEDGQVDVGLVETRDERVGMSTEDKRQLRASYLPTYERAPDADEWERTGKGIQFVAQDVDLAD